MADSSGSDSAQKQSYPGKGNMGVGGKEKSSSSGGKFGVKGGTGNHMFGLQGASKQVPGQSASPEGRDGQRYASGGGKDPIGLQHAGPQTPGVSQTQTSGDGGKFASGGKGPNNKMFGYTGSTQAPGGQSSR